jgi:hypothetical protein
MRPSKKVKRLSDLTLGLNKNLQPEDKGSKAPVTTALTCGFPFPEISQSESSRDHLQEKKRVACAALWQLTEFDSVNI